MVLICGWTSETLEPVSLQLLDVQACNSANKAFFQNPPKSLSAQWSIDVKSCLLAELQVKMSRDGKNSIIPSKYP